MSTLPEQFSAASKSQIQAQLDFLESFGTRAFDGAARLIALNIDTGRAAVDSSSSALKQLAAARDPRDLLALTKGSQDVSKLLAYGSEWLSIVTDVQAGLFKPAAPAALAPAPLAAPAPVPVAAPVAAPQVAMEAAPAPQAPMFESSEEQARPVKPGKQPVVAVTPEAAPEPVAAAKPIAKAAGKVAGKQIAAKPAAAQLASDGAHVLPQLKPVEASRPPAVFQQDLLTPKRGKKR